MGRRQKINKDMRIQILNKYDNKCSYCGKEIDLYSMQIDHFISLRSGGSDEINNLYPSCKLCNHYKRASDIETFRNFFIGKITERLKKIYIFRVAINYGIVSLNEWDSKFYFEKYERKMQLTKKSIPIDNSVLRMILCDLGYAMHNKKRIDELLDKLNKDDFKE